MRSLLFVWLFIAAFSMASAESSTEKNESVRGAKISKVLPHYLDKKGKHTLWPSLYERDAYQAYLRKTPSERAGMRIDVLWKSPKKTESALTLKTELRGAKGKEMVAVVLEEKVSPTKFGKRWTPLTVLPEKYLELGELVAWRVTLWDGEQKVAEQKSFLWQ